jgi:hypothetical protein
MQDIVPGGRLRPRPPRRRLPESRRNPDPRSAPGRPARQRRGLGSVLSHLAVVVATLLGFLAVTAASAQAAGPAGPCDIYSAGGTPCVAAHSTIRALYSSYDGSLYQVRRASDAATADIGVLSPGGYADSAHQDAFCAATTCVITVVYDQSGHGNDLKYQGPGGAGGSDTPAGATGEIVTAGGAKAYSLYINPGNSYWTDGSTHGMPTGSQPEASYMVTSGTHVNGGCCFDYGNSETDRRADGAGAMDAIYFGTSCWFGGCTGNGPWVQADLEYGLYSGGSQSWNTGQRTFGSPFVTAMLKNDGTANFAIKGGNAQSGGLTTLWDGARPHGYSPMKKQGAIILGSGGDCCNGNTNQSEGTFYEGAIVAGYPSDATEDAVQADINAARYQSAQVPLAPGPQVSLQLAGSGSAPVYVKHDDADDAVSVAAVTADSSTTDKQDATFVETAGLADPHCSSFESVNKPGQYLRHSGFQFHLQSKQDSTGFAQDATFCRKPGNSGTGVSFQSVNYTDRYVRAYDGELDLASDGGTHAWDTDAGWADDSSWTVTAPLAPTPTGTGSSASEQVQTTVTQQGGLTMSVDSAAPVVLPTPALTGDASGLASSGAMNTVTVTDTRSQSPGWNVVGQVGDFSNGAGGTIAAGSLGWDPDVVDSATGQNVTPGAVVAPGPGGGLGTARQLATAAAGSARGTARLGATLNLLVPTSTDPGTYTATLTLTAI